MNVVVTDEALADLANIQDYIAERSLQRANTFVDEILDAAKVFASWRWRFRSFPVTKIEAFVDDCTVDIPFSIVSSATTSSSFTS